ncbi:hypothetical protein G6F46_011084 [Rhizopus delemar]|nr:hypothetical protein G6F55_012260 [Rhizopus delemar]KAG1544903.1 hypothetical protein G6F51_005781 [Rhizopus arrhizus]KAG1490752.1 hypothetical protein G6F54_010500 [Rhizopus delemar]KAG1503156.1 hypothetical protein G6F53_010692 [Rhizopus delemar]KAG1507100.1 hypothetical protein G6F52_011718 [Rhizopus delemar]
MTTRYQKLNSQDEEEQTTGSSIQQQQQQRPQTQQQISDLQDTFGESFDDDDDDNEREVTDRLLHHSIPSSSNNTTPAILPVSTDGVFSNISAKPESDSKKLDETPPTYDEAAADATPPYWQTTIIAPAGMGDIVLVEGMPVGNIFSFFWNLMISASFQFVGFMLTYLLHTSHASKQGSRAGLGVSLIQTGFYIRSRGTLEDDYYNNNDSKEDEDSMESDIIAYSLMFIGWFIVIRSIADYLRAKQMEKIICSEPTPEAIV